MYTTEYETPIGKVLLASDGSALTGLWFFGAKHFAAGLDIASRRNELPIFDRAREWLDIYFSGREPGFTPPLNFRGSDFQTEVWSILRKIPYGQTATYGEISKRLAAARGTERMSARAVGAAVGRNPISIIVPCHRITGADGSLTGYAAGTDKKAFLLKLEGEVVVPYNQ